jgi:rubredoxin
MKKFVCKVCGYVYEGDSLPEDFKCPVCKAPAKAFQEVEGEMPLAAEHEFGVYAKTVKNNPDIPEDVKKSIFDQLMSNFQGECQRLVCIYVWLVLLIERVILKLAYIGKRLLMRKLSTQLSSLNY